MSLEFTNNTTGQAIIVPVAVTGATQANPCSITATAHGFATGDTVRFRSVGGMTQLNDNNYVITVVNANTFTLNGVNSTGYGAYTSGGLVSNVYVGSYPWTLIVQFMPVGVASGAGWVCGAAHESGHHGIEWWFTGGNIRTQPVLGGDDSVYTDDDAHRLVNGAWHQIAIVQESAANNSIYLTKDTGVETLLRQRTDSALIIPSQIWFGKPDRTRNGNSAGITGRFRYAKYWPDAALDATARAAEQLSATCVTAGGVSLWALPDGTTGTDSISGYDLTIAGGSTSASEPGYIGAAPVRVPRGMLMGMG